MSASLPNYALSAPSGVEGASLQQLRICAESGLRLALRAFIATASASLPPVDIVFGSAGRLAQLLASGACCDLLLTTDEHLALESAPQGRVPAPFATDMLVIAGRSELSLSSAGLLERLANPRLRIGVALPASDSGHSPVERFFARAEALQPGSAAALRARARPILSNGELPAPRRVMEMLGSGEVDVVLGAASALRTLSSVAEIVVPPPALSVTITSYMVLLASDAERVLAARFYASVLCGRPGQALLARHGFSPLPSPL